MCIRDRENNVLDDLPVEGTTKLTWENGNSELDRAEDTLYETAKRISEGLTVTEDMLELSVSERAILDAAHKRFMYRLFEMVQSFGEAVVYHDDSFGKFIFLSRFYWLIHQTEKQIENRKLEDELSETPGFYELCEGEIERLYVELDTKLHKKLFSPESFSEYLDKSGVFKTQVDLEEMLKNRTPEQVMEDELSEQEDNVENAKEEARNTVYLKEKCPTCNQKCTWFEKKRN